MWCRNCNIETKESICPICGAATIEDTPVEVLWCSNCRVPVLKELSQTDKDICPRCGKKMKHMAADIRPVFPEERLLIEAIEGEPFKYAGKSIWNTSGNNYFIDGQKHRFVIKEVIENKDANTIRKIIEQNKSIYPIGLQKEINEESIIRFIKSRIIPKNRAFVNQIL